MKIPVRPLLIGLLAVVTLASACLPPPPWRVRERHDERGERHERREDRRAERHERREDHRAERHERRDDRRERRQDRRENRKEKWD